MDHLSSLPDGVLCHVLSFLTTKEAALTSVLSKRWRDLFVFVPVLDVNDSVFLHPEEGKRERDGILESFMDFVDRVLALQGDSPINKVSIKCKTGVDSDRVDRWICNVLQRGVSDLNLSIVFGDRYCLSGEGFKSSKLVELEIGSEIDLGWSTGSISLPMLKTLILTSVEFCVDKLDKLLPACPALEDLVLSDINWKDGDVTLSSASLRNLYIYGGGCSGTFSFDTPSLARLFYYKFVAEDYSIVKMEKLLDARIFLSVTEEEIERVRAPNNDRLEDDESDEDDEDNVVLRLNNVSKLMNGIRNVQQLYLYPNTLEVLSLFCESMPVFENLFHLSFTTITECCWRGLPFLLENSPNLETLIIKGPLHYREHGEEHESVCVCLSGYSCLLSCPVKVVKLEYKATKSDLEHLKHLLGKLPCLELLKVKIWGTRDVKFQQAKYLLMLPRASSKCKIKIK